MVFNKKRTGGNLWRSLSGEYLFLLVLLKQAHLDATSNKTREFILRNATVAKYLGQHEISRGLKAVGMTWKKSSTKTKQAYPPINLFKRHLKKSGYPTGVCGLLWILLINIDECGLMLMIENRNFGHTMKYLCIQKKGNYCRDTKITVILSIKPGGPDLLGNVVGSVKNPCWWFMVNLVQAISSDEFYSFVFEDIVESFPENEKGRTFM